MRTEATRLLASGSEHLEDGNYTHAAADLGAASELFAKVIIAVARCFYYVGGVRSLEKLGRNAGKPTCCTASLCSTSLSWRMR